MNLTAQEKEDVVSAAVKHWEIMKGYCACLVCIRLKSINLSRSSRSGPCSSAGSEDVLPSDPASPIER